MKSKRAADPVARVRRFVRTTSEILIEIKVLVVEIAVFIAFIYLLLK